MAICNRFNSLSNISGNFLMFSQYVEDITRNYTEGDENHKVIPSNFIALNIDYAKLDISKITTTSESNQNNLNSIIPKYFEGYFENGCAYGRGLADFIWTPEHSKNLFWNAMWDAGFLTSTTKDDYTLINELMYYGDINMHSYNEHKGMGYGEIYCYIPTDAGKVGCQVVKIDDNKRESIPNENIYLEGYTGYNDAVINYSKEYYYNEDYIMSFNSDKLAFVAPGYAEKYSINTIVVLYDILVKQNDEWITENKNIPLGIYFTGKFDEDGQLTNTINKFVSTSYGNGTSYGLRICTRFSVAPNGLILNTVDTATDENYVNYCQLMTSMNENLSKMMEVVKSVHDTTQEYKNAISIIKNNRTNVPYVRNINGDDCWFINGRFVSKVGVDPTGCTVFTPDEVMDHLNGIAIDDCTCKEISAEELADKLGLTVNDTETPDNDNNTSNNCCEDCLQTDDIASREDIIDYLDSNVALTEGKFVTNDDYLQPVHIVNDQELDDFLNGKQ